MVGRGPLAGAESTADALNGAALRRRPVLAWLLILVAAAGAAYVCWGRVTSMFGCWRWEITDGREGPNIYALWRLLHGHALYEWPNRPPYSLTLYNFGFYHAYAGVMRVLGVDGEGLLAAPRVLTVLGAVVGAIWLGRLASRLARPGGAFEWAALASMCFVVWLGTQFFSWWPFDIRPDMWALTFALMGLGLVLDALERDSRRPLAAASLVFWLAWSFKQSCVWTFAGSVVAVAILTRKVQRVALLMGPFAVLAAVALLVGGPAYRVSLLVAPALGGWHLPIMLEVLWRTVFQNPWTFGFPVVALATTMWARRHGQGEPLAVAERAVLIVAVVAVCLGALAFGRIGSNKNHVFEGYVAGALASWIALARASREQRFGPFLRGAAVALLIPWALMPLIQIARPGRYGRTTLCSEEDNRELARLARVVAALPKPLYADHDVFSQPWQATNDRYPSLVLDGTWYDVAEHVGFVPSNFLDQMFIQGRFASGLFYEGDPQIARIAARGAECHPLAERPFGLPRVACRLHAGPSAE
jgi:hypothetical protein